MYNELKFTAVFQVLGITGGIMTLHGSIVNQHYISDCPSDFFTNLKRQFEAQFCNLFSLGKVPVLHLNMEKKTHMNTDSSSFTNMVYNLY